MDLLIGDEKLTGRGLGTQVIQAFVREIVFTRPDVPACYADPPADNHASLGAFRNAGFATASTASGSGQCCRLTGHLDRWL
jgi:RimJ/RimL family protein N-acetyltransferase